MIRELTCIVCPMGCSLRVETEGANIISISGNTCPRGKDYAEKEFTDPQRTITSTARCEDGSVLSVKTETTIPKDKMFECMEIINKTIVPLPISVGDVIIDNVFGTRVVATQNKL